MFFQNYYKAGLLLGATAIANCHFTLQYPNAIGTYNDALEGTGPCDSDDPTKVTASQFQNWPWQGEAVVLITTHPNVTWNFNVALFSEVTNDQSHFIPLTEDVRQYNGTGILCFGQVPGKKEWVGKQAIVQILQHAPDGVLSTCIAAIFTDGSPENGAGNCQNYTGPGDPPYHIGFVAGSGSDLNVKAPSSSSAPGSTSSSASGTGSSAPAATSSSAAQTSTVTGTGTAPTIGAASGASTCGGTGTGTGTGTEGSSGNDPSTPGQSNSTSLTSNGTPVPFTGGSSKIQFGNLANFAGFCFIILIGFAF
ncbi:hypothetical protein L207DRAFT_609865 [Hyaloscypha variabilis F]|uniref:Copper acquisition factor BIM1-like domain-containing protein n=1 Tax=Hyaloscypha variabilis (strain UAMH 11265 / GT02V1 / F) TaxID=1149755 RepID=A0A2J6R1V3_HYAVF|nr:hypothetical protein L207DRAFT_609865 [Hyaloscypha variabilis F]